MLILAKEIPEGIFFFKMADCVRDEVWAAKPTAFVPIQALISRILKQRKFKYHEGMSLNEQGQLFYLQMIAKMRRNTVFLYFCRFYSSLTIMAGVVVAHKLLKKKEKDTQY